VVARKASAGAELFGLGSFVIWLPAGQLWAHDRYAMFERFTDRARRAVVLAQEEARKLGHDYIGTEHLLLGLIRVREGVAAKALKSLGISLEAVRAQVEETIGHGRQAPSGHIPWTPRGKKVLELSKREARQLGHNYIGTEHLLLGLIREGEGVAAQVLVKLGADLSRVRRQVLQQLSAYADGQEGITAAEREELLAERLEPPDEELMAPAPYAAGDKIEEIHAVLREIVARLERIERHLTEGDDTP
jgi:ATP-dependent Clp protease ATP-binding subunit ClpA